MVGIFERTRERVASFGEHVPLNVLTKLRLGQPGQVQFTKAFPVRQIDSVGQALISLLRGTLAPGYHYAPKMAAR